MNLTETLLAVIVALGVVAAACLVYQHNFLEKDAIIKTQDNLTLFRANVEEIFDGAWEEEFGDVEFMTQLGIVPLYFLPARVKEGEDLYMKTRWGRIEVAKGETEKEYTVTLKDLTSEPCFRLSRSQVQLWKRIEVGDIEVWNRETSNKASLKDVADACVGHATDVVFTAEIRKWSH